MELGHHDAHDHDHHSGHVHAPKDFGPMFAIATALNVGLVAIQVFYGIAAHSVALLADAGHNFGDALGLVIAWGAHVLAKLSPTSRYTYGFRSASILAALLNSMILLVATGGIAWEAIQRFFEPGEVAGMTVMVVAAIGILINGLSAWLLMAGQKSKYPWRVPSHGGRRGGFAWRRNRWWRHHLDGVELARSNGEHRHIGRDRLEYVGPIAGSSESLP